MRIWMLSQIYDDFFLQPLMNGLFASVKFVWIIIIFVQSAVTFMVAVVVKSLELQSGWCKFKTQRVFVFFVFFNYYFYKGFLSQFIS